MGGERGQWSFKQAVLPNVQAKDTIDVSVECRTNLPIVGGITGPSRVGCFVIRLMEVLPRLRVHDRDADGLVYASQVINFDVVQDAHIVGHVFLSFETKSPVALRHKSEDNTTAMSEQPSDEEPRWGALPAGWKGVPQSATLVY